MTHTYNELTLVEERSVNELHGIKPPVITDAFIEQRIKIVAGLKIVTKV